MLKEKLLKMSKEYEGLKLFVITDILDYEDESAIKDYISDVLQYGCQSGIVTSLIYTKDTRNFAKTYFDECLEILDNVIQEIGKPSFTIDSNSIAWLSYEETLKNIASELGIY